MTAVRGAGTDRLRIAVAVLGVIGLGIATYLTYVHYAKIKVVCLSSGGCETVQSSVYAKLAGIPVPVLGLVGYAGILASLVVPGDAGRFASFLLALTGFLFSAYLTYRELFTIKAICQWCVGSAVDMTLLMIITGIRALRVEPLETGPPALVDGAEPPRAPRPRAARR